MSDTTSTESKGRALRARPSLIELDNGRMITSTGRWNDALLLGYLQGAERDYQFRLSRAANIAAARDKYNHGWVEVGELAKVAYGQNSLDSKRKTRQRLSSLFKYALLQCNVVLSLNYDFTDHGRIVAAKVFDKTDAQEVKILSDKLDKLLGSFRLTGRQYHKAQEICGIAPGVDEAA